ncbi:hypothetical protein Poli38472_012836 [Pythium oligandrum]|uniref:Protein preY, mitochondrial n=1 Tax=Pythium oligandrum TaxID=41045 RepID=A0A8K1FKH9_PYTOL|nr:hypothetical protein Poli38472_012836 [Pythium oligandrum]|eukprot:TMW64214.1 hypothetical protein Poli38472_012836 [Pythium oligandrum]
MTMTLVPRLQVTRRALRAATAARVSTQRSMSAAASDQPASVERLLDESVMEHLVCPISKFPLRYDAARGLIICPEIRVAYPIRNGIPMLVPSEGRILGDDEEA